MTQGFQGSETTGVEVTAYHQGDDPVIFFSDEGARTFRGRSEKDGDASVVAASTSKAMGASSGSFSVTLKMSEHMVHDAFDLRDHIIDDDWVDITFTRHGRPTHVMRGLVESVALEESTSTNGVTSKSFVISGRDFGAVFDQTKLWFNQLSGDLAEFNILNVQEGLKLIGDPGKIIEILMYGVIGALEDKSLSQRRLPKGMPGAQDTFAETFLLNNTYRNDPERHATTAQFMQPSGRGIWDLMQEYSDPMFTELFCDLTRGDGGLLYPGLEASPSDTSMSVFFRDKPFPTVEEGRQSAWFSLPLLEVPRTHVGEVRTSRTGLDRFNTFFVSPPILQDAGPQRLELAYPLWDLDSVQKHGLRPFNVESRYAANDNDIVGLARTLRERVRDWHALSPYFFSGQIKLNRLYPDARIGTRLRIPGRSEEREESYYIESVDHSWALQRGGRTSLGVTRGWRGGDKNFLRTLQDVAARYEEGR